MAGDVARTTPALLTTRSSPPSSATACSTKAATSSGSATSAMLATARAPRRCQVGRPGRRTAGWTSQTATSAPASARATANARPRPWAAPVTMARRPSADRRRSSRRPPAGASTCTPRRAAATAAPAVASSARRIFGAASSSVRDTATTVSRVSAYRERGRSSGTAGCSDGGPSPGAMPEQSPSARYWPRGSRWQRSGRCTMNSSGRSKARGSRLAAAAEHITSAPSGSSRPKRSTSWRVKRGAVEHRRRVAQRLEVGGLHQPPLGAHLVELVRVGEQQEPQVDERARQRLVVGLEQRRDDVVGGGRSVVEARAGHRRQHVVGPARPGAASTQRGEVRRQLVHRPPAGLPRPRIGARPRGAWPSNGRRTSSRRRRARRAWRRRRPAAKGRAMSPLRSAPPAPTSAATSASASAGTCGVDGRRVGGHDGRARAQVAPESAGRSRDDFVAGRVVGVVAQHRRHVVVAGEPVGVAGPVAVARVVLAEDRRAAGRGRRGRRRGAARPAGSAASPRPGPLALVDLVAARGRIAVPHACQTRSNSIHSSSIAPTPIGTGVTPSTSFGMRSTASVGLRTWRPTICYAAGTGHTAAARGVRRGGADGLAGDGRLAQAPAARIAGGSRSRRRAADTCSGSRSSSRHATPARRRSRTSRSQDRPADRSPGNRAARPAGCPSRGTVPPRARPG